jgi:hypothetical protein
MPFDNPWWLRNQFRLKRLPHSEDHDETIACDVVTGAKAHGGVGSSSIAARQ